MTLSVHFICRPTQHNSVLKMLPTPDISHLSSSDYEHVYEPAEDSFLFLDSLEKEEALIKSIRPTICLEVGSGSGMISTFLAKLLGSGAVHWCTDINPKAAEITKATGKQNSVRLEPLLMDLASGFLPQLTGKVDVLLFNPPYVVTPSEEVGSSGIEASWAGGASGREVTDRFLPCVSRLLSDRGLFYLVIIKENDQDELETILGESGLKMTVVMSRRSGPEHLSVLRFSR